MKLSVIIPVYNVELYVERCLNSVLTQGISFTDYEIIIQNDGSTDGSLAVVEDVVKDHDNCLVLSSQNRGLSAARNTALCHATGEYVWFVDSDDWIEEGAIKALLPYLNGHNDIVQFGYKEVFNDGSYKNYYRPSKENVSGEEAFLTGFPMGAQFSVYRRSFLLEDELFVEGIHHEDNDFTPRTLLRAKHVTLLREPLYNYFKGNANSTMSVPKIKRCYDLVTVSKRHLKLIEHQQNKTVIAALLNLAALELNTSLRLAFKTIDHKAIKNFICSIQKSHVRRFIKCNKIKYRLMAICCLVSVKWYARLLNSL